MKKFFDYFIDHPIIVNLLTVLITLMGLLSIYSLNKEVFPNVDFDYITIRATFSGTAAEDVEKLVTIPIERAVKEVDGIDELNAMSAEGATIVSLKIDPDYDMDEVLQEVRNAVADVEDLPEDVETPIIKKQTNRNRPLLTFGIYGKDEDDLRENVKTIRDELELNKGVASVEMTGYRDEVFDVQADLEKLKRYDMSLLEVVNAIRDRQVNVSAGSIKLPDREKLVRTLVENETVAAIENIVLRSNDLGDVVRVKDVAKVLRTYKDKVREERAHGKFAIVLSVQSKESADVLDTAKEVKQLVTKLCANLRLESKIFRDMSFYVERRLGILTENGIQGIILVTLCLFVFMNLRVSIITALGAPFAFFVAFGLMDGLGITINMISMFGLILVLGMLVDDAIIVAEQYYQYLEEGMDATEAAKKAAYETFAPVTSTVLTTIVAFSSLFFIDGIIGKFMWAIPVVVIIALAASWFECFVILPAHLKDFVPTLKEDKPHRWFVWLQDSYEKSLRIALRFPFIVVGIFIIFFMIAVVTIRTMPFELFPADDTRVYIKVKGPVGVPFEKTRAKLMQIEEIARAEIRDGEIKGLRTTVGNQRSGGGTPRTGQHYGEVFMEFTMEYERERSADEILKNIMDKIETNDGIFNVTLDRLKHGPPTGKPVNIEISSHEIKDLMSLSKEIKEMLDRTPGILSTEIDYEEGKRQLVVQVNGAEARRLGLDNQRIALEIRSAFEGIAATTIKRSDEDVDILVRLDENQRAKEDTLMKLTVPNNMGQRIHLTKVAKLVEVPGAYILRRFNRRQTFAISGEVDKNITNSREMNIKIKPELEKLIGKYKGIIYDMTGENKDNKDSMASFKKTFLMALFIIFILLVIQFSSWVQPFIIMSAIPFGLVGVVAAFKFFDLPIGYMAMMGMLGLVGVVINDSIVLVTFINRTMEQSRSLTSLIKASVSRLRPVILTTFTTVVGLLPVAHSAKGDPFLRPMATSFAYGLLFATTLTLIFVPCCYRIYLKAADKFSNTNFREE